jgi:hypothetical protein
MLLGHPRPNDGIQVVPPSTSVTPPSTSAPPATTHPTSSSEAWFRCDGSATLPTEFSVAAGPAGIFIVVDNTTGEAMSFQYDTGGSNSPQGEHAVEYPQGGRFWPLAPGDYHVKCVPDSVSEPSTVPASTLHVVDPLGYWVSSELECNSKLGFGSNVDWIEGAGWPTQEEAARKALDRYAIPGDEIERVGYPDEQQPQFVLVRDGRNIVRTSVYRSGAHGNWVYSGAMGCGDERRVKGGFHAPIRNR